MGHTKSLAHLRYSMEIFFNLKSQGNLLVGGEANFNTNTAKIPGKYVGNGSMLDYNVI